MRFRAISNSIGFVFCLNGLEAIAQTNTCIIALAIYPNGRKDIGLPVVIDKLEDH